MAFVFRKDYDSQAELNELLDDNKSFIRCRNQHCDYEERIPALVEAGVDAHIRLIRRIF